MSKNKRTTLSFFIDGFVRLFIGSALVILFFDIGITIYQLSNIKPIVKTRYHKLIRDHRSLFLNQIALNQTDALLKDMNFLRSELGVDKITVQYKSRQGEKTITTDRVNNFSSSVLMVAKILNQLKLLKPYKLMLTSDFGNIKANVTVFYSKELTKISILPLIISALLLYLIALIPIGIIFLLLFKRINKILVKPLHLLTGALSSKTSEKIRFLSDTTTTSEIDQLISASEGYIEAKLKSAQALNALAAQVAHDIRSTLYSLEMAAKDLTGLSENKRILIREATNHIKETIHNLEEDYLQDEQSHNKLETVLLMKIVNYVLEEKKEILTRGIRLLYQFDTFAYTAFIRVIPQELTRVLSNLLNNAIEASKDGSVISLSIIPNKSFVRIIISDTGHGISDDKLDTIFNQGVTYNKKDGRGLGLYHARNNIQRWNGKITIDSAVNQGTKVIIDLPAQRTQDWFAPGFSLLKGMPVIIVDDAKEVHASWKERFASVFGDNQPMITSFYSPNLFLSWYENNKPKQALYLIDYEYGKHDKTGVDIINLMDQNDFKFLVTSRSNQENIHHACADVGVKIIPKFFINHIPISIVDKSPYLIIIEPSKSLIVAYKHRAEVKKRQLICYESLERFMCDAKLFSEARLYIAEELLTNVNINQLFTGLDNYLIFITSYGPNEPHLSKHVQVVEYVTKEFNFE